MTPQEENERIILSHSEIKPEFIQRDGMTIENIIDRVFSLEGFNNADECPKCFNYGEYIVCDSDSDQGEVVRCDCGARVYENR